MALIGSVWVQTSWVSSGGWAAGTWAEEALSPLPVAGTGDKRTGDERLAVMQSFEQGRIESVVNNLQKQRDEDVRTALNNVGADDEETALIIYWLNGGF